MRSFLYFNLIPNKYLALGLLLMSGCWCGEQEPSNTASRTAQFDDVEVRLEVSSFHYCIESGNHYVFGAIHKYGYEIYIILEDRNPIKINRYYSDRVVSQDEVDSIVKGEIKILFSPNKFQFGYEDSSYGVYTIYYMLPVGSPFKDNSSENHLGTLDSLNWKYVSSSENKTLEILKEMNPENFNNLNFWEAVGDFNENKEINEAVVQFYEKYMDNYGYPIRAVLEKYKLNVFNESQKKRIDNVVVRLLQEKVSNYSSSEKIVYGELKELSYLIDDNRIPPLLDSLIVK